LCLRKGCGRKYVPRQWNQRYCQNPECLGIIRRWNAAQRQAKRREDSAVKAQHAAAEKARRSRARSVAQPPESQPVAAARGHATRIFFRPLRVPDQAALSPP